MIKSSIVHRRMRHKHPGEKDHGKCAKTCGFDDLHRDKLREVMNGTYTTYRFRTSNTVRVSSSEQPGERLAPRSTVVIASAGFLNYRSTMKQATLGTVPTAKKK